MLFLDPLSDPRFTVVLTGRDRAAAEAVAADLRQVLPAPRRGVTVLAPLELDVAEASSREAAVEAMGQMTGGGQLEVLVNNAGVGLDMGWNPPCPREEEGEMVERTMRTNFLGPLALTLALAAAGLLRGGSRVVNVSAGVGHIAAHKVRSPLGNLLSNESLTTADVEAFGHEVVEAARSGGKARLEERFGYSHAYGLSKLCLSAATRTLAREHADWTVQACSPGFVKTDLTAGSAAKALPVRGAEVVAHLAISKERWVQGSGKFFNASMTDCGEFEVLPWDDRSLIR